MKGCRSCGILEHELYRLKAESDRLWLLAIRSNEFRKALNAHSTGMSVLCEEDVKAIDEKLSESLNDVIKFCAPEPVHPEGAD